MSPGLRNYFATEGGGATLLLAASAIALVWANVAGSSYHTLRFAGRVRWRT
jgi:hypothetical protein